MRERESGEGVTLRATSCKYATATKWPFGTAAGGRGEGYFLFGLGKLSILLISAIATIILANIKWVRPASHDVTVLHAQRHARARMHEIKKLRKFILEDFGQSYENFHQRKFPAIR